MAELEDFVQALLGERLVEPKTAGNPSSREESSSVFQSVVSSLFFVPRTALVFEAMARNGLVQALTRELDSLDALTADIRDLANPLYAPSGEEDLVRARSALLHLEGLPKLVADAPALTTFDTATSSFLTKTARNVRKTGQSDLSRTADEAEAALAESLQELKTTHGETLDRLYKLAVGIENFLQAPFQALLGNTLVSRVRDDVELVLGSVQEKDGTVARDSALRIIAGREVLKIASSVPSLFDSVAPSDTTASGTGAASVSKVVGSITLPANPQVSVSVNGEPAETYAFFIGEAALLTSSSLSFPLTIPADYELFLAEDDGSIVRVPMAGTYADVAAVAAKLNSAYVQGLLAVPFAGDPSRWLVYSTHSTTLGVASVCQEQQQGIATTWTNSAHEALGFFVGQEGTTELPLRDAAAAINGLYSNVVATVDEDTLTITTVSTEPGTTLSFSMPEFTDQATASSTTITMSDVGDLQVGDLIVLNATEATATAISETSVQLSTAVPTAEGTVRATSALVRAHDTTQRIIKSFLKTWTSLPYAEGVAPIDRLVAPLFGNHGEAYRNAALTEVASLRARLQGLLDSLSPTALAPNAARKERDLANGIMETLLERRYDRAADAAARCDLAALLTFDSDTASYGGRLLSAGQSYAQSAMTLTNVGKDADVKTYSTGRA